jgi:Spy/CpxP family protein refolding chaperone
MAVMLTVSLACGAVASNSDIKSLSQDDQSALLAGRGMGLARPAELNGYPGPAHVLELAAQLDLSASQLAGTHDISQRMQQAARANGVALIEAERALDALYESKTATFENVRGQLARIENIRAHLRGVHLNAHLEQAALLTPHQRARYTELRGYSSDAHRGH